MNKYNMELPDFKAFQQIKIGSNTLNDIVCLFNISGYYPIIIGKGELMPKVWLYAIVHGEIRSVVSNNKSDLLPIRFEYDESCHNLKYTFVNQVSNQSICILSLESRQDVCIITELDLRPFGVKVYLEGETLHVGSIEFEHNDFSGNTFITVN